MGATTTNKGRARGLAWAVVLAACTCGGALGFVAPSAVAGGALAAAGGRRANSHSSAAAGSAGSAVPAAAAAAAAARPRALPRLYASKVPPSGGAGGDFMDSLAAGSTREMTTEEKVAQLQREVRAQAALLPDETETKEEEDAEKSDGEGGAAIPGTGEDEEPMTEAELLALGSVKPEDFVDEGKNIIWPNLRRAAQLTVLAVVAQIAFAVYIISLNSFLNAFPEWFGEFVKIIKAADVKLPDF